MHLKEIGIRLQLLPAVVRYPFRVSGNKYTSLNDVSAKNTCARDVCSEGYRIKVAQP